MQLPSIDPSWKELLGEELKKNYFSDITNRIESDKKEGKVVYPPTPDIFNAFHLCPLDTLKVVILGQDPYHGEGQGHGISFSVQDGIRQPPSLKNIFKEYHSDLGLDIPASGNLSSWAKQGILMLNAILTVNKGEPASHAKIGWETFTDTVIQKISQEESGIIFVLWGKFAQTKKDLIDESKHTVLESFHPSPFSARKGFFGSKPFSKINTILKKNGKTEINWKL